MKKLTVIISVFIFSLPGFPQIREISQRQFFTRGEIEFTLFSNLGKDINKIETSNVHSYWYGGSLQSNVYNHSANESDLFSSLGASISYYVIDGLSIGPEIFLFLFNDDPSYSVIGNISYTFMIPGKNVFPYLKAGYGWAAAGDQYSYGSGGENTKGYQVLNSSIGIKFRFTSVINYGLEVNYRRMSTEYSTSYSSDFSEDKTDIKIVRNLISVSTGIYINF